MAGMMSVSGMVSGLNTDDIMAKLEQVARTPITNLQKQKSSLDAQLKAWQDVNTRVLAVKNAATTLSKLGTGASMTVTSNEATVKATVGVGAVAGQYSLTVNSLSANHQLVSQVFTDKDTTSVGSGSLTITTNGNSTEVAVNELTLSGMRDAINRSNAGVTAFIVEQAGTYRLALSANTSGTAGQITLASTLNGGTAPAFIDMQAATDTSVTLGTGANALTLTREGTTLTDVIPGITLDLKGDAVDKTAVIAVTQTNSDIKAAINGLVTQYNALVDFVNQATAYDAKTGQSGVLLGSSRLNQIVGDLAHNITNTVTGLPDSMRSAVQVGLKLGTDGKLSLDNAVLDEALKNDRTAVLRLFSTTGWSDNVSMSYISSTKDTKPSGAAGYDVNILQAPERAHLTLGAGLPAALAQDETVTLNGVSIALTAGMTRTQVVAAINAKTASTSITASLTSADGTGTGEHLTLTQVEYGATSYVKAVSDIAAAAGGTGIGTLQVTAASPGAGNSGSTGKDVLGTINGVAATGKGQLLTAGDGAAKGLQLMISGSATGDYGAMVFSRGVGGILDELLSFVTRSGDGTISTLQSSLETKMTSLDKSIKAYEDSVTREMTRMRQQFDAMEVALSRYQNQSMQLAGLLSQLPTY